MSSATLHSTIATSHGRIGYGAVADWLRRSNWRHAVMTDQAPYGATGDGAAVPSARAVESIVVLAGTRPWLITIPASERLDIHKVRELIGHGGARPASEEEVAGLFPQFEPGALPPFGDLLGVPEIVDRHLLHHLQVACSAGDHEHTILLSPVDLVARLEPRVADVCRD